MCGTLFHQHHKDFDLPHLINHTHSKDLNVHQILEIVLHSTPNREQDILVSCVVSSAGVNYNTSYYSGAFKLIVLLVLNSSQLQLDWNRFYCTSVMFQVCKGKVSKCFAVTLVSAV